MSDIPEDDDTKGKKPPPGKVVVTYSAESKKKGDIPPEILPSTPAKVVSNPIDSAGNPAKNVTSATIKSRVDARIPEEVAPAPKQAETHRASPSFSSFSPPPDEDIAPPKPPESTQKASPAPPSGGGGSASTVAIFLSLMTMIAVCVLVFYTYLSQKNISALQSQSRDEKASVESLISRAKQSLSQVDSLQQESQAQQKAFATLKTDLQNAQMRLVALSGSKNWVISEVNYLIFMANERLRIARDIPTAITQLQAAEEKITMLGDPALWGLKEAITKDIAKLSTQPRVKKQMIWEQLNALQPLIAKAPFKTLDNELQRAIAEKNIVIDDSLPAWKKGLLRSWYEFKSLIRVTKESDNPIPKALSVQERGEIVRTMQLMSEQAQWAVLQGESKIYLASLESLQKWTKEYFIDSPEQQMLLERIDQLKTQPVDNPLADISMTLKALSSLR
ncbi:MAG: uroporphyrinogen-III C-methyltransferase [Candidatus Berkiella sp.]